MPQPHEILQVPPDATKSDVEAAYRRLTMYADPADARYRAALDAARMATLDDEPPKAAEATPVMAHRTGAGFAVGDVFSRTFSTLFGNPALFFGLTLVAWVPGTAVQLLSHVGGGSPLKSIAGLVSFVFSMLAQAATAYAALHVLRGNSTTIRESLSRGLGRLGSLILLLLLVGLTSVVGGFVLFFLASLFGVMASGLAVAIVVSILISMFAVMVPACVVERLGPFESLGRSATLTKGHRWKIFGLVVLMTIAYFVVSGLGTFVLRLFFFWSGFFAALTMQILLFVPQAFWCLMIPIMYYNLRTAKEGVSIDSLANVFD